MAEVLSVIIRRAGENASPLVARCNIVPSCLAVVRRLRPSSSTVSSVQMQGTNLQKLKLKAKAAGTSVEGGANSATAPLTVPTFADACTPAEIIAEATGVCVCVYVCVCVAPSPTHTNHPSLTTTTTTTTIAEYAAAAAEEEELSRSVPVETAALADMLLLRQSALSLLADSVTCAGWDAQKYIADVVDVACGILSLEVGHTEAARLSRRTATFLLRFIVSGLQGKLFQLGGRASGSGSGSSGHIPTSDSKSTTYNGMSSGSADDPGSHLLVIYRALKLAADDKDSVVQFHAQNALAHIGALVRADFTDVAMKEKAPKITILGSR